MDSKSLDLCAGILQNGSYIALARQNQAQKTALLVRLLSERRMPQQGWTDEQVRSVLAMFASMDSNNHGSTRPGSGSGSGGGGSGGGVGVGEREGRVWSAMVAERHSFLAHGVGRSGDIVAVQPKAPGSSLIQRLTHFMAADALRVAGASKTLVASAIVLPMATGMSALLVFLTLRTMRPAARFIVWPRIDQKSCLKSICTAGFTPIVVEQCLRGDEIVTDLEAVEAAIGAHGADAILCVFSTTSCFAPRTPDDVVGLAALCKRTGVPHVVNNAYGVQSERIMSSLNAAVEGGRGRIDALVQSTDKNFMVPVGGCVVAGPDKALVAAVSKLYPGRASMSPILDLFITLLSMGADTFRQLLAERKANYEYLRQRLAAWAETRGARLLETPANDISLAVALPDGVAAHATQLGSMLFHRFVSGARVVKGENKEVCGIRFDGYGSHVSKYPCCYLNAAAAIGMRRAEVDVFIDRLDRTWTEFNAVIAKRERGAAAE
ncbi:hypothetical protein HK105_208641 [Polyrhizophydium stewartii]|uniref:O-phosphoseryl-tRNA(Sec) selenium transferase n=1 Tax=Polyrhizophydium stewartii TaxID=2732419 RepID=A0ABR4MX57_9FUNG